MAKIIDGKALALKRETVLKEQIKRLNVRPCLASILIGQDPASLMYINMKSKKAFEVGINFERLQFSAYIAFEDVIKQISLLNRQANIDGIMVQLPLPEAFLQDRSPQDLLRIIAPQKDVDGLKTDSPFMSATVKAVLSILEDEGVLPTSGKIVVVGASGAVGEKLVQVLKTRGVDVLGVDQNDQLSEATLQADILISAVGKAGLINGEMIKNGVVAIDVGISQVEDKVAGDFDFASMEQKASLITPVPGGVGPMTIISLLENVVQAASS